MRKPRGRRGGRKVKRLIVREELNYLGQVLVEAYIAGNEIKYQQACSKIDKILLQMGRGKERAEFWRAANRL
jgi:hypothetical protein